MEGEEPDGEPIRFRCGGALDSHEQLCSCRREERFIERVLKGEVKWRELALLPNPLKIQPFSPDYPQRAMDQQLSRNDSLVARFNARVWWPFRLVIILTGGFFLYQSLGVAFPVGYMAWQKLSGKAELCPWSRLLSITRDGELFVRLLDESEAKTKLLASDTSLGIDQVQSQERDFWVKHEGSTMNGPKLIAYLIAEHHWMQQSNPNSQVRPGDVVVDVGGHVGVFTHFALKRGASKVIAFEPEPTNIECYRRNFAAEIAGGRVILIEKGLWSEEKVLELFIGVENSGTNSMVHDFGDRKVEVPVTTLDLTLQRLNIDRVHYIKMDIEGAERHALAGSSETLRRLRPRLMLDSYHEPDDSVVLPALLRRSHADYRLSCGPCQPQAHGGNEFTPHVTYYE